MTTGLFERVDVIDVDTHLTEPPDVWTARMPASVHDRVPHIERIDGQDVWMCAGERLGAPGFYSMAGHDGVMPLSIPNTYDDIHPSMYDAEARLEFMDAEGIHAQVLYPNVGGFGNGYFLRLGDRALVADCVRAYNDFMTDWTSVDPSRLIAVTAVAVLGRRAVDRRDRTQRRGGPPSDQLLQSTTGLRPATAGASALGSDLVRCTRRRGIGQLPCRWRLHGDAVHRCRGDGVDDQLRSGLIDDLPRQHPLRCGPDLRWGVPPFPGGRLRVGREWGGVGTFDPRDDGLAMAQWRCRHGAPGVRAVAERVLPSTDLRLLLVRATGSAQCDRGIPRQHPVRDRLPAPDVPALGSDDACAAPREYVAEALGSLDDVTAEKILHGNAARVYGIDR